VGTLPARKSRGRFVAFPTSLAPSGTCEKANAAERRSFLREIIADASRVRIPDMLG